MLSRKSHGHRFLRGVLFVLALAASIATLFAITSEAFAQTDVPDAPTAVESYSYSSQKLQVRWSSSDAASTTSFKIQWKAGSEEFDSSRQSSINRSSSIEPLQSTSAGYRYRHKITGLTNGTECTVRVIAANANGDSDPSGEATGTPQSTPGQVRLFIENEVIEIFEGSNPWLRDTWDYITTQNVSVNLFAGEDSGVFISCFGPMESNLRKCHATSVGIERSDRNLIYGITHELAHVYTLANGVTTTPGPLAVAHLYFYSLGFGGRVNLCDPVELYIDVLMNLTHGDTARSRSTYWSQCTGTTNSVTEQALAVVRSATGGLMPSWFATTHNESNGDPDLERVWADVKAMPSKWRTTAVFQLRDEFGGYCDNQKATASAFLSGLTRNPWSDGGCVPEAPTNVTASAVGDGKLTVSWQEPPVGGGSPIKGYKVR